MRCGKYIGDNDATCPQLTCIRGEGHPDACDNVSGDFQVIALGSGPTPTIISRAYSRESDALIVLHVARRQMPSLVLAIARSEDALGPGIYYGTGYPRTCLSHEQAIGLFRRLGW